MPEPSHPDDPGADEPGMVPLDDPRLSGLRRILWVMDRLRGDGGCPWDRAQTPASLRGYLLEETYELLEALDRGHPDAIREELGDVLFQVVFHARLAQEAEAYDLGDVAAGIAHKLEGRHPHVFDPDAQRLDDPAAVEDAWEEHKRREGRRSVLEGVPRALPSLLRAQRIQEKAARVGFDWRDPAGPLDKLDEELRELRVEVERDDRPAMRGELGDLLFSAVNLARHLGLDAEACLREGVDRFASRFRHVEASGQDLRQLSLEALDALWAKAKDAERGGQA